ncbi:MAG: hypothetical protein JST40_07145 [Armatimonadetes bacterium]|nr:hypothetical protein [Armatimonadota bacterium]
MDAKTAIIALTERGARGFFSSAKRTPADKLDWKPLDEGRSTLDQCQEVAFCPTWGSGILKHRGMDPNVDWEAAQAAAKQLTTVEACEAKFFELFEGLKAEIAAFPEAEMGESITLQWGTFTYMEIMEVPHWNVLYHWGQVNYIQTLYGDKEM